MSQILLSSYPSVFPNTKSLLLNGSSQYATLPGIAVDPNSDFTIEMWVKLSADGFNSLFSAKTDGNNYWILIARNDGEGLCFQEAVASAVATFICSGVATVSVSDGWTHIAVTRASNIWNIYKNGVLLKTDDRTASPITGLTTDDQEIGALQGAVFFAGNVDEVRVWNDARTAAELLANMYRNLTVGSEPNLVGYWRWEDTPDDETSNNDATLVGAPSYSTDTPYG